MKTQEMHHLEITLGIEAHRLASQFAAEQATTEKGKQVYLNTLAVYAAHRYLKYLGIDTDLNQSDCWNPILRHQWNVADLVIPNIGRLECRPILPEEKIISLPSELTEDRMGYLAIQFSERLNKVQVLGFIKKAMLGVIEVSQLHPIDELITELSPQPVNLSAWFEKVFDEVWLPIEALLTPKIPVKGFRKSGQADQVGRGKPINLGLLVNGQQLALLVSIWTEENQEKGVLIQVSPIGEQRNLPPGLKLTVTLESDEAEVIARDADNLIQLEFSELPGKQFTVKVSLDHESITEKFIV